MDKLIRKQIRKKRMREEALAKKAKLPKESVWTARYVMLFWLGVAVVTMYSYQPSVQGASVVMDSAAVTAEESFELSQSNPPTFNIHHIEPVDWGIYDEEIPDETATARLEHGGVWISYRDLDQQNISRLKNIAKKYPNKVILSPRKGNDEPLALVAWKKLLRLERIDEQKIVVFIERNLSLEMVS